MERVQNRPLVVRGQLISMDEARPRAEAMATANGHVVAIGDMADVTAAVPDDSVLLDLGDQTIVPGFIDSHNHMLWNGMSSVQVDLSRARTVGELLEAVRQWARANPGAPWVAS